MASIKTCSYNHLLRSSIVSFIQADKPIKERSVFQIKATLLEYIKNESMITNDIIINEIETTVLTAALLEKYKELDG
jgi:hypothetical protein